MVLNLDIVQIIRIALCLFYIYICYFIVLHWLVSLKILFLSNFIEIKINKRELSTFSFSKHAILFITLVNWKKKLMMWYCWRFIGKSFPKSYLNLLSHHSVLSKVHPIKFRLRDWQETSHGFHRAVTDAVESLLHFTFKFLLGFVNSHNGVHRCWI